MTTSMSRAARGEKFRVNTAALVDLKAALYHKQQLAKKERTTTQDVTVNREVSEKTSSIWKNVKANDKKNKNTAKDHKSRRQEASDHKRELSIQEEQELAKSRQALEAKAALYDRLRQGVGLREELEGDDGEENEPRFMVDFTKKIWQEQQQQQQTEISNSPREDHMQPQDFDETGIVVPSPDAPREEEEWVEFVDSFGRSRRCLKKDLTHYQNIDDHLVANRSNETKQKDRSPSPDLLSDDMRRERERQKWEEQAEQEVSQDGPLHYQSVQGGEIRSHGIGYYAFSTDETKRKEQLELLDKLRNQTLAQREKRQKLQEKRKAMMEARLAKVRRRKLKEKGIDVDESKESGIAEFDFEMNDNKTEGNVKEEADSVPDIKADISRLLSEAMEESQAKKEKEADERRAAHVRPWDKGKVVDPIRKRKQELRDERLTEFAPPSTYFDDSSSERPSNIKKTKSDDTSEHTSTGQSTTTSALASDASASSYGYPPPPNFGTPFPVPPPQFSFQPPGSYSSVSPYSFVPPPYGMTMTHFPSPIPPPVSLSYVMRPPPPPPGVPPTLVPPVNNQPPGDPKDN